MLEQKFEELKDHLTSKGWNLLECSSCKNEYFSKTTEDRCNNHQEYGFLNKNNKTYSHFGNYLQESQIFFESKKFQTIQPRNLNNLIGKTAFISAGIQYIEPMIFGNEIIEGKYQILQPCFRTQYTKSESRDSLQSFINIATIITNSKFEEYLDTINLWMNYFSKNQLYAGDFNLQPKIKENDWGTGKFKKLVLDFNYKGLQLGTVSFCENIPTVHHGEINVIDAGFGAERINWAKNKTDDIFNSIELGLSSTLIKKELYNSIRLLSLLALSGINHRMKEQYQHVKIIIDAFIKNNQTITIPESLSSQADALWIKYSDHQGKTSHTIIEEELKKRAKNMLIQKAGLKKIPKGANTIEELLQFLKTQKKEYQLFK